MAVLADFEFYNKLVNLTSDTGLIAINLYWISQQSEDCKLTVWEKFKSVEILLKFALNYDKNKMYVYETIANIILENDVDQLDGQLNEMVTKCVQLVNDCINKSDGKMKYKLNTEPNVCSFFHLKILFAFVLPESGLRFRNNQ